VTARRRFGLQPCHAAARPRHPRSRLRCLRRADLWTPRSSRGVTGKHGSSRVVTESEVGSPRER